MRVESRIILNKADIKRLVKDKAELFLEILKDEPPIPISYEAKDGMGIARETDRKKIPCPIPPCEKLCLNEFGVKKHLELDSTHRKDPKAKAWITNYKQRKVGKNNE